MSQFKKENGVIVSADNIGLAFFEGTPGHVEFDPEVINALHQANKGIIWKFVHTHPIGMTHASETDKMMLRTLAPLFYPFPVRLSVVTLANNQTPIYIAWERVYRVTLEPKGKWLESGRPFRDIEIVEEEHKTFYSNEDSLPSWKKFLIEGSFE